MVLVKCRARRCPGRFLAHTLGVRNPKALWQVPVVIDAGNPLISALRANGEPACPAQGCPNSIPAGMYEPTRSALARPSRGTLSHVTPRDALVERLTRTMRDDCLAARSGELRPGFGLPGMGKSVQVRGAVTRSGNVVDIREQYPRTEAPIESSGEGRTWTSASHPCVESEVSREEFDQCLRVLFDAQWEFRNPPPDEMDEFARARRARFASQLGSDAPYAPAWLLYPRGPVVPDEDFKDDDAGEVE